MKIPLSNKLKKRMHIDTGTLQDEVVEILYDVENKLILHGGTAIWRCYGGNRFSEDLDLYLSNPEGFDQLFKKRITEKGLIINKFKITDNLIFSKISNGTTEIRVELNFSAKKKGTVKPYEKIDGSILNVFTLSPEELLLEKVITYQNRRFIRDVYDIFHLLNYITIDSGVKESVNTLLKNIQRPIDEKNLSAIVYSGAVPSFEQIISQIKKRFSR